MRNKVAEKATPCKRQMLGKGLESLIPKKQGGDSTGSENAASAAAPLASSPPAPQRQDAGPSGVSLSDLPILSAGESAPFPRETRDEFESRSAASNSPSSPPVQDVTPPRSARLPAFSSDDAPPHQSDAIFQIDAYKIDPNPQQPRKYFDEAALGELADSIREHGILQPLIVSKKLIETESGTDVRYELIAGERRLLAAKRVGLPTVPVIIRAASANREKLELAIIENLQRADLNAIEEARAFARLQDEFGLTQREVAVKVGKSRETVSNTLRLLNLPTEIQVAIEEGKITESQARVLLQVSDIARQKELFYSILRTKPTVRQLKSRVRRARQESQSLSPPDPRAEGVRRELEEALGTKVRLEREGNGGRIEITFYSDEELEHLVERITRPRSEKSEL